MNYIVLVIGDNYDLVRLLEENNFQVYSYLSVKDADDFYHNNNFKIDLIVNLIDKNIETGFTKTKIANILDLGNNKILFEIKKSLKNNVKTEDFNKNLALSMLDDNEKIYNNILKRYCDSYSDTSNKFYEFLNNDDYQSIREYVHKIKGISLYLGSEKLLEMSKTLEFKIVNNQANEEDIRCFLNYHNRILEYSREQVNNV